MRIRIRITKRHFAWFLLIGSIIGWPISAFTFASDEPQAVLALSWIAIIVTALDALWIAQVQEDSNDD